MSADDNIDESISFYMDWCKRKLSYTLGPYILSWVVFYKEWMHSLYEQGQRTARAIKLSFKDELISFLPYNSLYIPIAHPVGEVPLVFGQSEWLYDVTKETFFPSQVEDNTTKQRIPYLGATLTYQVPGQEEPTFVGDLSSWLGFQFVWSPNGLLPLQVLVAAWAHSEGKSLYYDYKGYILNVMTEDLEEKRYDLSTGLEIQEVSVEDVGVADSTEDTSNEVQEKPREENQPTSDEKPSETSSLTLSSDEST